MNSNDLVERLLQNLVTITDKKVEDMKPKVKDYSSIKAWGISFIAIGLIFAIAFDVISIPAEYLFNRMFSSWW